MSALRAATIAAHGMPSTFRVWNQIDNWCTLCKEPFGQWNEHRGKRDHICLELFFEAVLDYHRVWNPPTVWATTHRDFRSATMAQLFGKHDVEERERRESVYHMLRYLSDEGVVVFAPTRWREPQVARIGAGTQGALVMYKWMHPHILNVFPAADAKQISGFSQMCASMYNLETTFDVCGLKDFIGPGDLPPLPTGESPPLDYAHKAFILRHLLGQLRWAMDSDVPKPKYHAIARRCEDHVAVIAEKAGHALITDMIFCRVCEYVSRVEPVWKEQISLLHAPSGRASGAFTDSRKIGAAPRHLAQTPRTIAAIAQCGRFGVG
jgi:hypothetical protein